MDFYSFELILMTDYILFVTQVKCWQIRKQSKAPQAAGAIHTDFERGFICAEVLFCYWSNNFVYYSWICGYTMLANHTQALRLWRNMISRHCSP